MMDYSFGNWVRRRRKALDFTQQQLAQRVGCSESAIYKIEADERRPSRQIAELLAHHLEIPSEQHDLFLKVARQEKSVQQLVTVPPLSVPQPVPAPSRVKTNLTLSLTSIVGREHELQMINQQLLDPACRLLTLTGPGGVGKTRLAMEVAHQLQGEFYDGVWFVPLAGTSASEFIIPAIIEALEFTFSGVIEQKQQLYNYLKEKRLLLRQIEIRKMK
jgi:transcriptional regulator with XRE-family HTH domain